MHIFLQGRRGVGKSTVIRKTLEILDEDSPLALGGFFSRHGGKADPVVYMRPAGRSHAGEEFRVAGWDDVKAGMLSDVDAFDRGGVLLLRKCAGVDLIIMDELGYLESGATLFKQAVFDALAGDIPVFGVLRLGDVPWHTTIKSNPLVRLYDVDETNRDELPEELALCIKQTTRM